MTTGGSDSGFIKRAVCFAAGCATAAVWAQSAAQPSSAYKQPDPSRSRTEASKPAPSKPAAASLTPQQLQTERIKASIAKSPVQVVETAPVAGSANIAPPRLAASAAPASNALLYRTLTGEQEREVHDLVAHQLKWPVNDPEKESRTAVFKGIIQSALGAQGGLTLKAIAAEDAPLRFNPDRKLFEGRIQVGFVELGSSAERPLDGNFAFQIQGPVTSDPQVARVMRTAPPFEVIRVSSNDPGPEVRLTVRSTVNPEGAQLTMKVVRPEVEVRVNPPLIQGLGLETADIVVSSKAPQVTRGLRIQLASDGGRVEPLTVVLDDSGIATARIRSAAVGRATVRAEGPVIASGAQASVAFQTPWRFIGSALIGGLAGGVLRKGAQWRTGRRRLVMEMLVAVLTGAVVFSLFALGVNLLGINLPSQGGEVLVFVVSALGAFIGTRLFAAAAPHPGLP
jgi:hypothetical protein